MTQLIVILESVPHPPPLTRLIDPGFYPGINTRGVSHREGAKLRRPTAEGPREGTVVLGKGQRAPSPSPPVKGSGGAL